MNQKFNKIIGFLIVSALILANGAYSFADDESAPEIKTEETDDEVIPQEVATSESETAKLDQEKFLERISKELNLSKTDYKQLLNNISDTKNKLNQLDEEKLTLEDQVKNLDNQVVQTTKKLLNAIGQILEKENTIILLEEEIEMREIALNEQKELLKDYVKIIYEEENEYIEIGEDGSVDAFKLLLFDGSVGENLRKINYLDLLNGTAVSLIERLDELTRELKVERKNLDKNRKALEGLKQQLTKEKKYLDLQKDSKQQLLKLTLGQEEIYKNLLEQTLEQQQGVVQEIKELNEAVKFIEARVKSGLEFDPKSYENLLDKKTKALYDFAIDTANLALGDFIWPVEPFKGLSAYFRDPGYSGVFGVQHNAVDIPAYQGTPIMAAMDGVVYAAKDNEYGYSYIIVAHAGGLNTVYGHVSSILVDVGDIVAQGSIIGLSGGMPGTLGAGYMTTGPHLHLEVLLNGVYVDPLNYLPLDVLSVENAETLPEKYLKKWKQAVFGKISGDDDF